MFSTGNTIGYQWVLPSIPSSPLWQRLKKSKQNALLISPFLSDTRYYTDTCAYHVELNVFSFAICFLLNKAGLWVPCAWCKRRLGNASCGFTVRHAVVQNPVVKAQQLIRENQFVVSILVMLQCVEQICTGETEQVLGRGGVVAETELIPVCVFIFGHLTSNN